MENITAFAVISFRKKVLPTHANDACANRIRHFVKANKGGPANAITLTWRSPQQIGDIHGFKKKGPDNFVVVCNLFDFSILVEVKFNSGLLQSSDSNRNGGNALRGEAKSRDCEIAGPRISESFWMSPHQMELVQIGTHEECFISVRTLNAGNLLTIYGNKCIYKQQAFCVGGAHAVDGDIISKPFNDVIDAGEYDYKLTQHPPTNQNDALYKEKYENFEKAVAELQNRLSATENERKLPLKGMFSSVDDAISWKLLAILGIIWLTTVVFLLEHRTHKF